MAFPTKLGGALAVSGAALAGLLLLSPDRAPACTLTVASGITGPDGLLILPVSIESQSRATGIQFDLVFDGSALDVSTVAGSSAASTRRNPYFSQLDASTRRVLVITPDGSALPDGVLVNLFVRPTAPVKPGTYPVTIKTSNCTDSSATTLAVTANGGAVKVTSTASANPHVTPDGLLNAASLLPGPITSSEAVTLIGNSLGNSPALKIGGLDARILYADSNQINAIVPDGLSTSGTTGVQLLLNGNVVAAFDIALSSAAPGIFTRGMGGTGYASALNEDGAVNMPSAPADRGSIVTISVTGIPQTASLSVQVGGKNAVLLDAVPIADNSSILQVRFKVPQDAPSGPNVNLSVGVGDAISQASVWLSLR